MGQEEILGVTTGRGGAKGTTSSSKAEVDDLSMNAITFSTTEAKYMLIAVLPSAFEELLRRGQGGGEPSRAPSAANYPTTTYLTPIERPFRGSIQFTGAVIYETGKRNHIHRIKYVCGLNAQMECQFGANRMGNRQRVLGVSMFISVTNTPPTKFGIFD